jgi:hypothetical protein
MHGSLMGLLPRLAIAFALFLRPKAMAKDKGIFAGAKIRGGEI